MTEPSTGATRSSGTSRPIDVEGLIDPTRCPACGAGLSRALCQACGVDLGGSDAARVWQLSETAARALTERAALLDRMLAAVAAAGPSATVPSATGPSATGQPATARPAPTRPGRVLPRVGVQGLLVGLGVLLLAVAAVTFLVLTWGRMPLPTRAAVIAGVTVVVLLTSGALKSRVEATAEALGALGVLLVLADLWAVRRLGLAGAETLPPVGYLAVAAGVGALLLGGWSWATGVRAGGVAAAVLAPAALVSAGLQGWVAGHGPSWLGLGFLLAGALGPARVILGGRRAERGLLLGAAGVASLGLLVVVLGLASDVSGTASAVRGHLSGMALCLGGGLVASAGSWAELRGAGEPRAGGGARSPLRRAWSGAAGGWTALAGLVAGVGLAARLDDAPGARFLAAAPVGAAGSVLAAIALGHLARRRWGAGPLRGIDRRASTGGAFVVVAAAGVPAAADLLGRFWAVADSAWPAWRYRPGDRLAGLLSGAGVEGSPGWWAAAPVGVAAVAVCLAVLPRAGGWRAAAGGWRAAAGDRWSAIAATTAGLAVIGLALVPAWPVAVVAALLGALGWGAPAIALRTGRDVALRSGRGAALLVCGGAAAALAVLLSWSTRPLTLIGTLAAGATLLVAGWRLGRSAGSRTGRFAFGLLAAGSVAVLVAVGVVPDTFGLRWTWSVPDGVLGSGLPAQLWRDRLLVAGLAGLILAAVALLGRVRADLFQLADRAAVASPGPVVAAVAVVALVPGLELPDLIADGRVTTPAGAAWWPALSLALAATVLAAVTAWFGPSRLRTAGAVALAPAAAALTVAAVGLRVDDPVVALPAALVAMLVALPPAVLSVLRSGAADIRRLPDRAVGRFTALATPLGVGCLVSAGGAVALARQPWAWLAVLLAGATVALLAALPGWHRWGWVAGLLLTWSSWLRLDQVGVQTVEAYTVPPALALIAFGCLRMARSSVSSMVALGPGLLLGLSPSLWVVIWPGGPVTRVVLLALAAAVVILAGVRLRWRAPVLIGSAVLAVHAAVQLSPWLLVAYQAVPRWVWFALLGSALLGIGARYERQITRARAVRLRLAGLR